MQVGFINHNAEISKKVLEKSEGKFGEFRPTCIKPMLYEVLIINLKNYTKWNIKENYTEKLTSHISH